MVMRKSNFLTFIFAFMPGAGQMYLGMMKKGVSIMGMFFVVCGFAAFLNLEIVIIALPVIWFYSFFDALNYNNMPYEKKALIKDEFIIDFNTLTDKYHKASSGKNNVLLGGFLTVFGVYIIFEKMIQPVLWELGEYNPVLDRFVRNVPTLFVAFAIVLLGLKLINSNKSDIEDLRGDYKEFDNNNEPK